MNLGALAVARSRMEAVATVDDFLDMCELDEWARERRDRPTLSERLADADPDQNDHDKEAP